jgi:hypothetical protein
MSVAEEFNLLDMAKLELILGVLLVLAGVAWFAVSGDTSQSVAVLTAGIGLITLATAGKNAKKMDATVESSKQVAETLKQVVLCGKPPGNPACQYEMKTEIKA